MHVPQAFVWDTPTKLVINRQVEYVKFEVHTLVGTYVDGAMAGIMNPVDWQAGVVSTSNTVTVMELAESVMIVICTSAPQKASMSAAKPVDVDMLKEGEIERKEVEVSKGKQQKPYKYSAVYSLLLLKVWIFIADL